MADTKTKTAAPAPTEGETTVPPATYREPVYDDGTPKDIRDYTTLELRLKELNDAGKSK